MNDVDWWNDLEKMDKRTKVYKQEFKAFCKCYIGIDG